LSAVTTRDREDFEFLAANARDAKAQRLDLFTHLDQPVGIWNYIRMANEIAALMPRGRLLDWGCGFGQMTWLLRRRGLDVTAFDVQTMIARMPDLPLTRDLGIVWGSHPTKLPFPPGAFDAVLSCGVLEHVDEYSQPGNEILSLREIHRVLVPSGRFLVYQLPQLLTWQEAITRTLGIGYSHPRRYTAGEIRRILAGTGFRVERLRRNNLLPKNLTGIPERARVLYSRFSHAIIRADAALSAVPVLNQIAGVMEIVARREP
jgi:SAM-dependent methyltransferase